nr:hypothetical protein [uncultured archaeon]AQS33202.1 hypothetical protein [uncultured archaeon]
MEMLEYILKKARAAYNRRFGKLPKISDSLYLRIIPTQYDKLVGAKKVERADELLLELEPIEGINEYGISEWAMQINEVTYPYDKRNLTKEIIRRVSVPIVPLFVRAARNTDILFEEYKKFLAEKVAPFRKIASEEQAKREFRESPWRASVLLIPSDCKDHPGSDYVSRDLSKFISTPLKINPIYLSRSYVEDFDRIVRFGLAIDRMHAYGLVFENARDNGVLDFSIIGKRLFDNASITRKPSIA